MDEETAKLIRVYEEAEAQILRAINSALLLPDDLRNLRGALRQVQKKLAKLNVAAENWTEKTIATIYREAVERIDSEIKNAGTVAPGLGFGKFHEQAVIVLAENASLRLENVSQVIGRRLDDLYRNYALDAVRGTTFGFETWKGVAKKYREKLAAQGITGFVDRAGRRWNMKTYVEMVAITTTAEAAWVGTENRLLEHGFDLVKVSTHRGACDYCLPWQGRILSLTGRTEGFPTMKQAKDAGFRHPRCRHAFGGFVQQEIRRQGNDDAAKN